MIGQRLGSFLIEEKIGSGAMGVVFRALNEKTGKPAAVKIITGDAGSKAKVPQRFKREADILQQFRHPNIVRFYAVGRASGTDYFAMEYLTGGTLEDVLDRREFLPWKEAARYAVDILDALHYAHQRNVVHRDLKPSNLLFSDRGQVKLTDFGIAKDLDAEALTATGRTLGTAAYMAPEQIRGDPPVSHKTDLYAMGCLLFQMLTGKTPFGGNSPVVLMHLHLTEKPPRVSSKNPDIPKALDDLVLSLMAKEPQKRPWDAEKVRSDIAELLEKADRGEEIPMVFSGGLVPSRMGSPETTLAYSSALTAEPMPIPSKATKEAKKKRASRFDTLLGTVETGVGRRRLETLGLVALLLVVAALVVYIVMPPGAETLHSRAKGLMESKAKADWLRAELEVLPELDRRFPDRYVEDRQAWRDQISDDKTRRRAAILEKPNLGPLSQPKAGVESEYVAVYNEAAGAVKDGDDQAAITKWDDFAKVLRGDDPEERPWMRLAGEKAREIRDRASERETLVVQALDRADRLVQDGKGTEAETIRRDVVRRYSHVRALKEMIRSRARVAADEEAEKNPPDSAPK